MKKLLLITALSLCGMAVFTGCGSIASYGDEKSNNQQPQYQPQPAPQQPESSLQTDPVQQGKLVVTPFENRGSGLDAAELDNLQDYLINAFINTGRFQVPDRNALALLANEQKFQLSDWADDAKSAQMGKVLNADYIVRVIAMHDGEMNVLTARILDVNTANGLSAAELEFATQRDARGKMEGFVGGILQRIGSSRPRPESAADGTLEYKVGGRGPAGGWVFYDKGILSNGWRYLEAAPTETEFTAQWGAFQKEVNGTAAALGRGKQNTEIVVQYLQQTGENGRAAQLCASLNFEGKTDWFLPSKDELDLMYRNLKQKGLGEFSAGFYWSSSQGYNNDAWGQFFSAGNQQCSLKTIPYSVRAVRAF